MPSYCRWDLIRRLKVNNSRYLEEFWYFKIAILFILLWNRETWVNESPYLFYNIAIYYNFTSHSICIVFVLLFEIFNPYLEVTVSSLCTGICSVSPESSTVTWSSTNKSVLILILRRSRTGTVWFYTSTSNKRAARPKLYTKSLTGDLKLMYSHLTLVRISIKL